MITTSRKLNHSALIGSLAQSVEQLAFNQLVVGSNPTRPTTFPCISLLSNILYTPDMSQNGFSLFELIVAFFIAATLAIAAHLCYCKILQSQLQRQARLSCQAIANQLNMHFLKHHTFNEARIAIPNNKAFHFDIKTTPSTFIVRAIAVKPAFNNIVLTQSN